MASGSDIQWIFDIVDNVTQPLAKIERQLEALPKDAKAVEKSIHAVEKALMLQKIAGTSNPLKRAELLLKHQQSEMKHLAATSQVQTGVVGKAFSRLGKGAMFAGAAAVASLAAIGAGAVVLGKGLLELGIDASSSKKAMMGALEVFEGKGADNAFSVLQDMGIAAGISADQTVEQFLKLRTAGFQAKEAQDIIAASFDVSAQMGGGAKGLASAEKFQDLMSKIGIMSKAGAKDLKAAVMGAGVPIEALQESVAKRMKIPVAAAQKALEAGKVGEKVLQNSLLDAIQDKFDGGKGLGTKALNLALSSPTAQIQSLKDAFGNLFEDVDISPFASSIKTIVDQLRGPVGEKLKGMAEGAFKFVGAFIGKVDVVGIISKLVDWFTKGTQIVQSFGTEFFKAFDPSIAKEIFALFDGGIVSFETLKVVASSLGRVFAIVANVALSIGRAILFVNKLAAPVIIALFEIVSKLIEGVVKFVHLLANPGKGLSAIGEFFKAGFDANAKDAVEVGKNFGDGVYDGTAKALAIQSPSKKAFELGQYYGEGFSLGKDDSLDTSVGLPSPTAAAGSAHLSGVSLVVSFGDVVVSNSREAVEEIKGNLKGAVLSLFEELGYA